MATGIKNLFLQNPLDSDVLRKKAAQLGADFLGGGWQLLDHLEVVLTQITGGQSNLIYLATSESPKISESEPNRFLIRVHCQPANQVFTETVIFSILSERGLGPKLYGFFPGGRLEEYLDSTTLDVDSIKFPENARRVGTLFAKYHQIDVPISKRPGAIQFIRNNLELYKQLGGTVHKMCPNSVFYPNESIPMEISVEQLADEIKTFKKWASVFDDTIVFSHNDLAPLNVLEMNDTKELVFIDFEYASYNWRALDLCMHLCENAFDYRVPPPGVKIDQEFVEHHPNLRLFCESYIDSLYEMKKKNPTQMHPKTEDRELEVNKLMEECKFFIPLANLFWAVWSLRGHLAKHENGHDLEVAASDRLSLYFHFKPQSQKIYEQFSLEL